MKKTLLFAGITVTAIAIAASLFAWHNTPFRIAEAVVKKELNDPGSAKFRNLKKAVNEVGALYICGDVNAKNRMGGYVGYVRFLVMDIETKPFVFLSSKGEEKYFPCGDESGG